MLFRDATGKTYMTSTDGQNIVQRLLADKPMFHLGGQARWDALPQTLEAVRSAVRDGDTTLEVGVGVSTVVFAACGANHTAISPDTSEHERVRAYCKEIGVDDSRLNFAVGLSDDVLPSLLTRERTLDVALIDGAHSFPYPIIDWYYVTRSLKVGGRLLMDDIPVPVVTQIFRHMRMEPNWRIDRVYDNRAAAFTMLAPPRSDDEWFEQPFNKKYPDFSFVGMPQRLKLGTVHRFGKARYRVGQRYPALRRIYKRVV
jgi:hypothetical protein